MKDKEELTSPTTDDVYKYIDETCKSTVASLKETFGTIKCVLEAIETITLGGYRLMSDEEEQKLTWKPKEFKESAIPLVRLFMVHSEPVLNIYYTHVSISVCTHENSLEVTITYPKERKDRYGQPKKSELWIDLKSRSIIIDDRVEKGIDAVSMIVTNQILDAVNDKFTKYEGVINMNEEKLPNIDGDVVVLPDLNDLISFADMDRDGIVLADSTTPLHEEIKVVCILGESRHAEEIEKVKDDFVKKGYAVITEPYGVEITDTDLNCIKESVENSICVANLIYVVNVDGIDSITEDYIKFAKTLNKNITYHLQKEIDLSAYFTIKKNRVIEEVIYTYSNLIRTTKAIEPIIGKMVELSDEAYMNYSGNRYTGEQPMIHSTCSIIGPVTNILWNGYTFNIATNNERINGVTQQFVKFVIAYPDCNLYGIPKTATLHIKIDGHKYSSSMDATSDSEIEKIVCEIFNAVIKEFNATGEKIDETAD